MTIRSDEVAVIGMSCRFPGADSVSRFWDNLCAGRDSLRTLSDRQLRAAGVPEADIGAGTYVKVAAMLDDIERFDPGFFKISPLEAELMDPQIRLLLQCAWEALEDAGYAADEPQNIGVFAGSGGVTSSYFSHFVNVNRHFEKITASPTQLGNDKDFLATYISYKLNLTGPGVTVQTACSTSMVALHQACKCLAGKECDMALAGGVSIRVPHGQGYHYKEGFIFSKSGRMRAFDEGADGVVFGSGLGIVLLKRLADAIRDGDHVYAVVKGSAISNDGREKMSYAASSARGQIACIRSALRAADVEPDSIGFVESHGTGTAMGDPEEVKALTAAFKSDTERKGYCGLGAAKTNVGHLDVASGMVSFIKAVLAVKHGLLPPILHYARANRRIRFENTPFYVNTALQNWGESGTPRRAAVNSLGLGGTNAFVVLEEFVPQERAATLSVPAPVIVPVSAKSQTSLKAYAHKLRSFLSADNQAGEGIRLDDLAYTLQTGRRAMDCRVAFVVSSIAELNTALQRYCETGEANSSPEGEESDLAAQWTAGAQVEWEKRYQGEKPRRISLPTYVFAMERYWIEAEEPVSARVVIHPLLHVNTSDLNEQRYSSTFTADESFLRDHQIRAGSAISNGTAPNGASLQKILPGVAYLEMARAAIEQAAPQGSQVTARTAEARLLELRDVVWLQPLVVAAERQVNIALVPNDARVDFEVYSEDERIHCQGQSCWHHEPAPSRVDLAPLKDQMRQGERTAAEIYAAFEQMGLHYGPAHRTIETVYRGERQLLAALKLSDSQRSGRQDFVLHPSLMDGALQAAVGLLFDPIKLPNRPFVPFALQSVRIAAACPDELFVWARQSGEALDVDLIDQDGEVCVQIRGFSARALGKDTSGALLATAEWQPGTPVPAETTAAEQHIILCGLSQVDADRIGPHCVHAEARNSGSIAERYAALSLRCLERLQSLIRSKSQANALLQIVVADGEDASIYAGLAGMLKTARLECPRVAGQIIFTPADIRTDELAALLNAECGQAQDTLIQYADGVRQVMGWRALAGEAEGAFQAAESPFKDQGVYLITGGLGGLGVLFAREILERTPTAKVILTGRAPLAEVKRSTARKALLEALQAGGRAVEYRQLHLDKLRHVKRVIADVQKKHKQLNGVIHSAGATRDSFILKKTARELREVFEPKVTGTLHLDQATQDIDLDFLVLFSALGSALGNVGQADYVAANGFMDQFACLRNRLVRMGQRRGHTLAIRWPFWQDGGMQLAERGRRMLQERTGTYPLHSQTGLQLFQRSLASGCDQTLAVEGDLPKIEQLLRIGAAPQIDAPSRPESGSQAEAASRKGTASVAATKTPAAPSSNLAELTEEYLRKQFCALLKLPLERVDIRAPLGDYGIDSLRALDFTRQLEQTFGPLSKTLFFEHLNLRDLAGYFVKAHSARLSSLFAVTGTGEDDDQAPVGSASPAPADSHTVAHNGGTVVASIRSGRSRTAANNPLAASGQPVASGPREPIASSGAPGVGVASEPIAIVGLSGRYPQARNIEEFWLNLRDGKDCIVEIPPERWDWRDYYTEDRAQQGHHFSKWGGFIEGVDEFDARFFNISPLEAQATDPQERLFLQHAWNAMEDAGYTRTSLQEPSPAQDLPGQVGVYAGVMYGEYQLFGAEASVQGRRVAFASNLASIANRVSYVLNLHGPSMVVDTMCSSSLTAIHLACQDLKLGRTSVGIAGGVNVTIHPNKYLMLSVGQFISGDGHCQSFGEGGDGYIPGEGVGAVILKRLSDAQRDGNHIYGLIRGSGLSHGGKTNGYTVPNPLAQASAIRQAFAEANLNARHVSYIEAHGTGTKLGDPIEITGLSRIFQESTSDTQFCLIGSAKSNIGHCEAAAGIAGLTKVLLQLKHRQVVPSLHSSRLNPHIDFPNSPFVVCQSLQPWEQPVIDGLTVPRIAGISSFGAGGSNAHLVIEEYAPAQAAPEMQNSGEVIVPLSARTPEQLQQKARDLLDFITADARPANLASIAYTLQTGREAMDERLAFVASSVEQLTARLQAYVEGRTGTEGVYEGQVKANKDTVSLLTRDADLQATLEKWVADRKWPKLADLWVKGLELDWRKFYLTKPRLMSLPTYPFARQRHWTDAVSPEPQPVKAVSTSVIHPLLHSNTSDFSQVSFTANFSGAEFFVSGAAAGEKCLTPGAYLEMARVAIEKSMPARGSASTLELRNVAWARPGVPVADQPLTIALFDPTDGEVKFEIFTSEGSTETVHCQGEAFYSDRPAAAQLDIVALRERSERSVADLLLPGELEGSLGDYVLHPALLEAALAAAGVSHPVAVTSVRIIFPCSKAMFACVRDTAGAIDVDLCDEHWNVCVQMQGIRAQLPAVARAEKRAPKKIATDMARTEGRTLGKPNASISLTAVEQLPVVGELGARHTSLCKARVSLAATLTDREAASAEASSVSVLDHGSGVIEIRVAAATTRNTLSDGLIEELLRALRTAEQQSSIRVLVITGTEDAFLTGGSKELARAVALGLYESLAAFPYPVIAGLCGQASGPGLLAGALCDFMVLSESGQYSASLTDLPDAAAVRNVLEERFGRAQATAILAQNPDGESLKEKGWTCPVVPQSQVDALARSLAEDLARKPQLALRLLKKHLARHLLSTAQELSGKRSESLAPKERRSTYAERLRAVEALPAQRPSQEVTTTSPVPMALGSKVITATAHPEGVLVVQMADRVAKNMFSDAFTRGMREVFAHIEQNSAYKVVLLTGFDNYFSAGGTRDTLLAIHEGKARFTDNMVFQLPLSCRLPVIAAMQGHAIGAGWAMGMFADFTLFSAESRYRSPYMGYGFTPGAAATLIFPQELGYDLARETLLTAREYSGDELQQRGVAHPVLPRDQVVPAALELAKTLAQRPRAQLMALKEQWAQALRRQLQETCDLELAMHQQTFVGQADTLALIRSSFAAEASPPAVQRAAKPTSEQRIPPSGSAGQQDLRGLTEALRGMLAHELRMPEKDIGEGEQFADLGLDSITGVTWIRRINEKYGTAIEAIKVYSYPTLIQLSQHVKEEAEKVGSLTVEVPADVPPAETQPLEAPPAAVSIPALTDQAVVPLTSWRKQHKSRAASNGAASAHSVQPIAVIGMAGQFPKAKNLEEFWQNIAQGRDCISEVSKDRWDIDRYYQAGEAAPGKTNSRWVGALQEYDRFDPAFFNISPREARSMDPQQRLFLQACWQGIENAGYNPKGLSGSKCGVFVGCSTGDYHQLSRREQLSGQGFTGAAPSILAARISYFLDLQGPSLAIDTACSSSLVAIATACDSLISGSSDLALAGGVNVMAGPAMHIMTAQVGMLSPHGRCFTFDQRADGIAIGEGVGVVLLKRLADAERDRDSIYAVVEGWGVNQDGKTNGITAPNPDSQARLQQSVYDRFGIDPAGIQLIEAHGTGTPLGDPIEVAGLKASFGRSTRNESYCALGSVKSNIGHCLTAAGISGFTKILQALRHKQLPPTVQFRKLNEHISLQGTPFYVNTQLREWEQQGGEPRRAAINSFGFSGTNAHVAVAEYVLREEEIVTQSTAVIVPLSARTPEQLEQQARNLLDFLQTQPSAGHDLQRLAYTLQVGREAMNERVAFVIGKLDELSQKLRAYVERGEATHRARVSDNKDTLLAFSSDPDFRQMIEKWVSHGALPKLADLWVKGLALDWQQFLAGARVPRRMGFLPTYPFAKERYWIDATPNGGLLPATASPVPAALDAAPLFAAPGPAPVPAEVAMANNLVATAPEPSAPAIPLELLQQELQASLAEALFMKPTDINANRSFTELGLDSIIGVEWVKSINKQYDTTISTTRIYDYPTVKELAAFVQTTIGASASLQTEPQSLPTAQLVPASSPAAQAAPASPPAQSTVSVSREELSRELKASLAEALYIKPGDIDSNRLFTELGLDSIIGVEWVKAINKRYGTNLSAIRIYDYPNVKELASYLSAELAAAAPVPAATRAPTGDPAPTATSGFRFEPKAGPGYRDLYFYSSPCGGDFNVDGEFAVACVISPETNVCLKEHVVFNEHLLPTDAYLELVYSAYRTYFAHSDVSFKNISIVNPLLGNKGANTYIKVVFRRYASDLQFFVRSSSSPGFESEKVHVQGFIGTTVSAPSRTADSGNFTVLQELTGTQIPTNAGTYYAPLQKLQFGAASALGHIQAAPHNFKFLANPFVLYGGLCTVINFGAWLVTRAHGASDDQFLPHRIERMALPGPMDAGTYLCHARLGKLEPNSVELDFEILDAGGKPVAIVTGISLRRVARKTIQQQVAASRTAVADPGPTRPQEKVAIIGMSCRYPMGESVDAFWNSLKEGRNCISEVPAGRWDDYPDWYHPDPRHPHTSYSKWGGFLQSIDAFDPLFFGISPAEAEVIDPQQRIFMEQCWNTIESAGYAPSALSHQPCGIYVGCSTSDYTRVLADDGQDTVGAAFMGTSNAILAARISYLLNLKGPALAIDTACSSSLVAIHLACESIRSGETQWALAGGINVLATPLGHILTSQVGMPSRDGRCCAFDAAASGIVFSEGCGVVLLKALSRARMDNDTILGVIHASGVNQDGKTNGITAPSAKAQEQLLQQIYGRFSVDPRRITYIEAHGTATPLGDPIEVNALTAVFQKHTAEKGYCALGSVKSNIGHTAFAAGVAGIIKVLLCIQHRKLVPSIHYATPNPHIDFAGSPFFVNTEYRDWVSEGPRLAAVSSFGFSGTNAHIVIEEDTAAQSVPLGAALPPDGKVIVPLSARDPEQLQQKAADLLRFIRGAEEPIDLGVLSYTLQVGRDAMQKRVAFIVKSIDDLAAKLNDYVDGKASIQGVHRAPAVTDSETLALFAADEGMRYVIDQWIANRNLAKVVELWVRGLDLEWNRFYPQARPRRMALPTYPFARQRCWVDKSASRRRPRNEVVLAPLHPLVHANTSDLGLQSYSTTFNGDEFFLTDHRVSGQKVLPAVAYLEMARAAVCEALPAERASSHVELRHVVWAQPVVVTARKEINIAVFAEEDDHLQFQIFSPAGDELQEVMHCQGHCTLVRPPQALTLDLQALRQQMTHGTLTADALYPQFASRGLEYGPAFQGITAVHQGNRQLLVELNLPRAAKSRGGDYLLHPSLMDSALQGSITLIDDLMRASGKPSLPFALESVHILAPCAGEMTAWVRYSGANSQKMDIDLADRDGNVCVQMRGFSSRPMTAKAVLDEAHYLSIIDGVLNNSISVEQAAELG